MNNEAINKWYEEEEINSYEDMELEKEKTVQKYNLEVDKIIREGLKVA